MRYNVSQLKANVCIIRNEHPTRAHVPTRAARMPPLCDCSTAALRIAEDFLFRGSKDILSIGSVLKYSRSALLCAFKVDRFARQRQWRQDRFVGKSAEGRKTHGGDDVGEEERVLSRKRAATARRQRGCLLPSRLIYLSRPNSTSRRKCDKPTVVTHRA